MTARIVTGVLALGLGAGLVVATGSAAQAAPPGEHDSFGAVNSVTASADGLLVTGWATDPDSLADNHTVVAVLDGRKGIASTVTDVASTKVAKKYGTGPTAAFSFDVPVPAGSHTVCIVARNTGPGLATLLRCIATPLGTKLTSTQVAAHSPVGRFATIKATAKKIGVTGWADDPDYRARKSVVVLYVDGTSAATLNTSAYTSTDVRPAGSGLRSKFRITVPATSGSHVACLWVVNVGLGSNSSLGCREIDTRGKAGTGPVVQPALNKKVVTQALKHKGQSYVWGAEGPKTFDCSGLVMYSYGKYGFATPRVAADQFTAARLIPASRAVPGDLVFFFDSEGAVYHVGIYVSPGKVFAAIDEAEGVNYQTIWDPSSAAYGSFTHT
jgi:cell wall-associated NlpC family hydrolase